MARFAYLKSCYERFRRTFSHIPQVIAHDSINHYICNVRYYFVTCVISPNRRNYSDYPSMSDNFYQLTL